VGTELYCSQTFSWISQNYVKWPAATHAELVNMRVEQSQIDIHQLFDGDILWHGHSLLKNVRKRERISIGGKWISKFNKTHH
jgi:hypothetical protein